MRDDWTPKPADRFIRHPRQDEISPIRMTVTTRKLQYSHLASPLLLLYLLAALIILGTVLLLLPIANTTGQFTPFMVAFFTATSAATLTGLVLQETATYWSHTGQAVILALTFAGGFGFMTVAAFLLLLASQRLTPVERFILNQNVAVNHFRGIAKLGLSIFIVVIVIQAIGFAALFMRFLYLYSPSEALWQAAFHAVSAFNNSGFSTISGSQGFAALRGDVTSLSILSLLAFVGGLGYLVIINVVKLRSFSKYSLNTKLVLVFSVLMIVFGALGLVTLEYQNPATLGHEGIGRKILDSFFHAILGRTSGFDIMGSGNTYSQTNFFFTAVMFVGGASASTAGGIKVNTFAVMLISIVSTVKGKDRAGVFGREIAQNQVWRAMVVGILASMIVFVAAWGMDISEVGFSFNDLFFEVVSAFGTVGLSTGITSELSIFGKLILMFLMLIGRIGPIMLGLIMISRAETEMYRYARERVTIG